MVTTCWFWISEPTWTIDQSLASVVMPSRCLFLTMPMVKLPGGDFGERILNKKWKKVSSGENGEKRFHTEKDVQRDPQRRKSHLCTSWICPRHTPSVSHSSWLVPKLKKNITELRTCYNVMVFGGWTLRIDTSVVTLYFIYATET